MSPSRMVPASGNPLIDHQHGRLSELIRLAAACARDGGAGFETAVKAFHDALAEHFTIEGTIYRGAGFEASDEHNAAHTAIVARIRTICEELSGPPLGAPDRHAIIDEMERVLFDHELLEDSGYWEVIRDREETPAITWDRSLETGIDWVDEQHRHLVAIINELGETAAHPGKEGIIAELMERFLRHARQHFAAEERWLAANGGGGAEHLAEHIRLLEGVESLAMAVGSDPNVLVTHYLRFWMVDHIRSTDFKDFGSSNPA